MQRINNVAMTASSLHLVSQKMNYTLNLTVLWCLGPSGGHTTSLNAPTGKSVIQVSEMQTVSVDTHAFARIFPWMWTRFNGFYLLQYSILVLSLKCSRNLLHNLSTKEQMCMNKCYIFSVFVKQSSRGVLRKKFSLGHLLGLAESVPVDLMC